MTKILQSRQTKSLEATGIGTFANLASDNLKLMTQMFLAVMLIILVRKSPAPPSETKAVAAEPLEVKNVVKAFPATTSANFRWMAHVILAVILIVLIGKSSTFSGRALLYVYGLLVSVVLFMQFYVALKLYRDPYLTAQGILGKRGRAAVRPLVSIMVAVKDEENIIWRCLESLVKQTYDNIEVIVVNDASEDGTGRILDFHKGSGGFKVIHLEKNVGKKRALARAMQIARGSIFAFTDSDSVMEPEAIAKCVDIFEAYPDVGAVSGHCRALNADTNIVTKIQDTWYEGQFSIRKAFESYFGAVTCVSGPLAVFRRDAVYNYIPAWEQDSFLGQEFRFATDRTMTGFVLGSASIGQELKDKYSSSPFVTGIDYPDREWKIVYTKSARAMTHVPDTLGRVLSQQIRWKKSFIRNIFFTGRFYWRKPLAVSSAYYLHILFVFAGPLIAFRHIIYFPLHGDILSAMLYISGIVLVGLVFGLAYRTQGDRSPRWLYRPLMSLGSTLLLSWLVFYSALTIRKSIWKRS